MRHDYVGMSIAMADSTSLAKVDSGTLANIAIVLFVSVLAIIHLKAVIQPLVVATLIFFLIRPPAQWLEERIGGHPSLDGQRRSYPLLNGWVDVSISS